jgi:4-aminobutyrate aminotransferase/(S)-3-amino-2-methylpropionate transaminase
MAEGTHPAAQLQLGPYNRAMTESPSQTSIASNEPFAGELPETQSPSVCSPIPGPESRALAVRLAQVESRNVTALDPVPIFWERASSANLWDVDGNRFVDLTAAFGVANVGHAHPDVVHAVAHQAASLLHGMGDVHPPRVKVELLERLARLYPKGEATSPPAVRTVLSSSGSDAVETAIKTALLATGRAGILAFEGAYHGLSLGALDCTWREDFREPFRARLPGATRFVPFGDLDEVERVAREAGSEIGAILFEPVQGRGGERVPPPGFVRGLRKICDAESWLLIADEIYTGFGRTGAVFACDHEAVVPDLLCAGKGLASGMPISACMGLQTVFDAWPQSKGEALHTQTFLGHPTSCAAALASLAVSERWQLAERAKRLGLATLEGLRSRLAAVPNVHEVRGLGLMIGIECTSAKISLAAAERLLAQGYVLLPSGPGGCVLSLTPPLTIADDALADACEAIACCLEALADEMRESR